MKAVFSLAVIAFGAFELIVPTYDYRSGNTDKRSLEVRVFKVSLLNFSLRVSEDFLIFQAIAVLSEHLSEGTNTQRLVRRERKTQQSSLISKEKVSKVLPGEDHPQSLGPQKRANAAYF